MASKLLSPRFFKVGDLYINSLYIKNIRIQPQVAHITIRNTVSTGVDFSKAVQHDIVYSYCSEKDKILYNRVNEIVQELT